MLPERRKELTSNKVPDCYLNKKGLVHLHIHEYIRTFNPRRILIPLSFTPYKDEMFKLTHSIRSQEEAINETKLYRSYT